MLSKMPKFCHRDGSQEENEHERFLTCAELILLWLNPQELANVASTCKTLHRISKSVTQFRCSDASRGLENLPVPFINSVDQYPYAYFIYTPSQLLPSSQSLERQPWGSVLETVVKSSKSLATETLGVNTTSCSYPSANSGGLRHVSANPVARFDPETQINSPKSLASDTLYVNGESGAYPVAGPRQYRNDLGGSSDGVSRGSEAPQNRDSLSRRNVGAVSLVDDSGKVVGGCDCKRCDESDGCPCLGMEGMGMISECGAICRCGLECGNRSTQRGISVLLKIVRDRRKGWCLCADQRIPQGQFVCEYAGELLTTKEARRRQQIYDKLASEGHFSSALLVVREHLPSGKACLRMNIDATRVGNIARFINHSCDGGNLSTVLVRSSGDLLPRLCVIACRDIRENEELTFSYGDIRVRSKGLPCFCGSSCCHGTLPSEDT